LINDLKTDPKTSNPQTQNLKPQTLNPKPPTPNHKPQSFSKVMAIKEENEKKEKWMKRFALIGDFVAVQLT
jgi:hypothetical protein